MSDKYNRNDPSDPVIFHTKDSVFGVNIQRAMDDGFKVGMLGPLLDGETDIPVGAILYMYNDSTAPKWIRRFAGEDPEDD